jgi:signal transduction histidine kinase/CheY-like chemotaxis protein
MIGKNHFALYPHAENEAIFARVRDTGVPVEVHDRPFVFPDQPERGTTYWDWTLTPVKNDAGDIDGLVFSLFETTQRKRAEEALRELNATLESKVAERTAELEHRAGQLQKLALELSQAEDQERRRLAEILHDDLQQILAAAKFHLGLLSSRVKRDPSQYAVATQIDHMLKDAIEKSRSLSHELSPAVLHHGGLIETFEWLANQVQTKHGLLVRVDASGQIGTPSDALKAFLYRAAQELLFNVVKHARVNEARIHVRQLGRYICLSVSDHGRGLDREQVRQTAGFGLLSIRERVELLGGRMKIRSAKGKGSTFFVVVPDGDVQATETQEQQTMEADPRTYPMPDNQGHSSLRVLLADDHEIVREGLISLLSEEGTIQVVGEAANGREAVDLASRLQPDVVIMDVSMPLINGDEATRQIKQHLPRTRVVALSMSEERETIERMRAAGAEAYVLKTAPSEELLAAIRGPRTEATT